MGFPRTGLRPWGGAAAPPVSANQQPPCATQRQLRPMAGSARHPPKWSYLRTLLLLRPASRSALLLPYFTFGPSSRSRGTTMAAADFWRFIPAPRDAGSPKANRQTSPGITHSPSRLCLSDIRHDVPCKNWALQIFACSPHRAASIRTPVARHPVRQASALPAASSGFHLAMDTLAVRLTVPLAGPVLDFNQQVSAPCRAHQQKGPRQARP